MAIKITSLSDGQLTATSDVIVLNVVPAGSPSMVVRNVRFVNNGVAEIGVNLYLNGPQRFDPLPGSPSTVKRSLIPAGTKIPPNGLLVVDQEITLESTRDQLLASLTAAGTVDYMITGFTRDL